MARELIGCPVAACTHYSNADLFVPSVCELCPTEAASWRANADEIASRDLQRELQANEYHAAVPFVQVAPRLWLGSEGDAVDLDALTGARITHVLVMSVQSRAHFPSRLEYCSELAIVDEPSAVLPIQRAVALLDSWLANAANSVLVHCLEGRSRSAAIVAAWLVAQSDGALTVSAAVERLGALRRIVAINHGFARQLQAWANARWAHGSEEQASLNLP